MNISIIEPIGGHGGMDYYDYGLACGLGENDAEVVYYTSDKTTIRNFKNVKTKLLFKGVWNSPLLLKTYKYIAGHINSFIDSKKNKTDIVHLHFFFFRGIDYFILLIAKFFKFKVIATIHDVNSFHNVSNSFVEKGSYKLIDGVIVHNRASLNELMSKHPELKNVIVIPHGNYLPFITPVNDTADKAAKPFNILFFGQIKQVKGIDVLLKAIHLVTKQQHDIKLTIAGKAWKSDLNIYQDIIHELGLKSFVKTDFRYIPDEEVGDFFAQANLVVLPYREIYQSGVLLLAMSYGKPILCSDLKPFTEILNDGETGFVFKSEDHNDMADKILKIMESPDLLLKIKKNASELIKRDFNWFEIGKKTKVFYGLISN